MKKSTARGIKPGIFKLSGRHGTDVPVHYIYAETTIRPGESTDAYYKGGWVETNGAYLTYPDMTSDPKHAQSASGGMQMYVWRNAKHRRVSWDKLPAWWQGFFKAHLEPNELAKAKK